VRLATRLIQRLLVLGLGVVSVWLIVFVIFKIADRRLPWVLALSATYGLAAYVILPRVVRMSLKILQRRSVPAFTVTGDGLPGDPVNLVLIGDLGQLRTAFLAAGWSEADRLGLASSLRMAWAFVTEVFVPDRAVQHVLPFRALPGHRLSKGDRRQPAQAPSYSLLVAEPRASGRYIRNGGILA